VRSFAPARWISFFKPCNTLSQIAHLSHESFQRRRGSLLGTSAAMRGVSLILQRSISATGEAVLDAFLRSRLHASGPRSWFETEFSVTRGQAHACA